ncbi:MAG: DNA primase [Saprospiraceae bacterium]|nr:DNA primase [Saprospiraceae bacterium]
MISEKTVQEILETAKIEEVIQDYVSLKRRGVNMIGLCPFHNEKTPSFTVSPAKNIYKCFGCGKGGNPVQFLMEHEQFTFPEALRHLAGKYGIEIEETEVSPEERLKQQQADSLFLVNQFAKDFYQNQLFETDMGKSIGLSYFKERGFREETIKKFGLGYAPDSKDQFTLTAVNASYNLELLKKLGLSTQYGGDFFRNRVMFTIHNLSGKVVALAGRIMAKDVKAPKYINSPETEIYHKSNVLYGAYFAKTAIRKQDECILVEGYTDVISLHQAGIENVVASSGTSLTVEQIRLIKRYSPNVKILFDGDNAGIKAALRGVDMLLEQDLNIRVVILPEGEDPDSYLKKAGTTAFLDYINGPEAKDFILFKADLLLKEAGNDPIKRAGLIKEIVHSIARVPDPLKRSLFVKECSRLFEVDENLLINETNKTVSSQMKRRQQERELDRRREQRQADRQAPTGTPPPDDGSFPTMEPGFPSEDPGYGYEEGFGMGEEPPVFIPEQKRKEGIVGDEFQEKDIVRLLISSGGEIFDKEENITVAEYLLHNIEDVIDEFDNQLYKLIAHECQEMLAKNKPITSQVFINHENPKIQVLSVNLMSSPYEFSENWGNRFEIFLNQKQPDANFIEESSKVLMHFRLRKITRICEKNRKKIKELSDSGQHDESVKYLHVQLKLDKIRTELAKSLGIVVVK